MKDHFLKSIYLSLTVLFFIGCTTENQKNSSLVEKKKPNIVFFIADDMYPWMFNNTAEGKDKAGKPSKLNTYIR